MSTPSPPVLPAPSRVAESLAVHAVLDLRAAELHAQARRARLARALRARRRAQVAARRAERLALAADRAERTLEAAPV